MTSQTTAKTAPVDLRLLLRAALVDLRKPISAWAASTHAGKPPNYGRRGKYLMSVLVLVQGRRQCTISPSTIVRALRMSSWCLGQRLFWVLQEVSGHCVYGHETRNRPFGCIVWASWRLTTCELSYLCQESPSPRPIFGQRVLARYGGPRVMRSKPLASPCSMTTRYVCHASCI
jgi:hypothetical protein